MKFVTRRDLWLNIIMWICIIISFIAGLSPLFKEGAGIIGGTIIFLFLYSLGGFIAWLWVGTYFVLNENDLLIRYGPFSKSIPLKSITKVMPTRSWQSSPATSIRRIEISYGLYDNILISPLDEDTFLSELRKRCPDARIENRTRFISSQL